MRKIILASQSPRRKELLEIIGLKFKVESSNYQEDIYSGLEPHEIAQKMSLKKAQIVASKHKNALVIAADTVIVFDDQILGKPVTLDEARIMLQKLNGKSHSVITGFSVIDTAKNKTLSRSVETKVFLKKLTPSEIGRAHV
jgi:septum formation protein